MANENVGGLFQYTNRATDLTPPTSGWQAGDSWDVHYTQAGFDDRDRELEDYLGGGITTRRFSLVDAHGVIVATLTTGVGSSPLLSFIHNDSLTTNSDIYWTQPNLFGAGFEEVVLHGPIGVADAGTAPAFILSRSSPAGVRLMQVQGISEVNLLTQTAAAASGSAFVLTSAGPVNMYTSLFSVLNVAASAHAPIEASAFTVVSSEREKIDIRVLEDSRLLDVVRGVRAHRFRYKTRPQTPLPEEVVDGHQSPCRRSKDHNCATDECSGTATAPCAMMLNDTHRFGLIAEHVHKVAPEIVNLDDQRRPSSLSVDQIAATAFGAVGALLRKVEALEARVAQLEGLTPV